VRVRVAAAVRADDATGTAERAQTDGHDAPRAGSLVGALPRFLRLLAPKVAASGIPSARARTRSVLGWTWFASLAAHAAFAAVLAWVAYRALHAERAAETLPPPAAHPAPRALELPAVSDGLLFVERERDPAGEEVRPSGGADVPRVDDGARGRGGEATVEQKALNLADRDERLRLSPDLLSRLDRDQISRIDVRGARSAWEDRRSTTKPMELTFLASGDAERMERRPKAATDPSRGALDAPRAARHGGDLGAAHVEGDLPLRAEGARTQGSAARSPGRGVREAEPGVVHRASSPIARARPMVIEGPVSVPATERARPRDDVDSEQEVATTLRSLVHASTAGGLAGRGVGGTSGGGAPGAGGERGEGSTSRPLGTGFGDYVDIGTRDPRLMPYFRKIHARIEPYFRDAFPKSALLELKQGTVILDFVVTENGTARVVWPPIRPSGIAEFDRNCAEAIRRAAPFDPLPKELGVRSIRIRAPFVASNPMVK
jgi:TonB family protein